jgi:hypothetical protein
MILIHTSEKKIKRIKTIKQLKCVLKPNGLWYAENKLWIDFSEKVLGKTYKYYYVIRLNYTTLDNPDKHKVLKLSTVNDFDMFTFEYGYVYNRDQLFDWVFINWDKVSKNYGGIEVGINVKGRKCIDSINITNKYKAHDLEITIGSCTWFYVFDIPSGCVWDRKAIESLTLI